MSAGRDCSSLTIRFASRSKPHSHAATKCASCRYGSTAPRRRRNPRCRIRSAHWPSSTWRELRNDSFDVDFDVLVNQLHGRTPRRASPAGSIRGSASRLPPQHGLSQRSPLRLMMLLAAWSGALDMSAPRHACAARCCSQPVRRTPENRCCWSASTRRVRLSLGRGTTWPLGAAITRD